MSLNMFSWRIAVFLGTSFLGKIYITTKFSNSMFLKLEKKNLKIFKVLFDEFQLMLLQDLSWIRLSLEKVLPIFYLFIYL